MIDSQGRKAMAMAVLIGMATAGAGRAQDAEVIAHWKFERDDPFADALGNLTLTPEPSDSGKYIFKGVVGGLRAPESKGALLSPGAKAIDLRLRVNAPTRGGNPFRLSGVSWALSGWIQHNGMSTDEGGQVIAGTHGFSPLEGRGYGGWSLRLKGSEENAGNLSVMFSTGGEAASTFEVTSELPLKTGADEWHHVAVIWQHDGGTLGKGEARLYVDGKIAGKVDAPASFDFSSSDVNAFRGLWIAGWSSDSIGAGSGNWAGRLDEFIFMAGVMGEDAIAAVMEEKEKPKPVVAKADVKPKPAKPSVDPKMKPEPAPKEKVPPPPVKPAAPPKPKEVVHEIREWKDLRGTVVEAAMVSSETEKRARRVLLRTKDEIEFSLPVERLSEEDQGYVREKGG